VAKDLGNVIDSIITLSKDPVKDISFMMLNINDYLEYLENTSFIAKPFIRKDLSAVMNMDVKELYDLLDRIKDNLEKIDIAASSIKDQYRYQARAPARKYLFSDRKTVGKMTLKEEKEKSIKGEIIKDQEKEEIPDNKDQIEYAYCPECGHKCKGQNGLKIHVRIKHKEKIDEILKMMELYDKL